MEGLALQKATLLAIAQRMQTKARSHLNEPERLNFAAAVFDLDGVVTQTAEVHFRAWKLLFDDFLSSHKSNASQARDQALATGSEASKQSREIDEKKGKNVVDKSTAKEAASREETRNNGGEKPEDEDIKNETDEKDTTGKAKENLEPFTKEDYLRYVDGLPRYNGVKNFLESRGISLPFGSEDEDDEEAITICSLGNKKDEYFKKFIKESGAEVYESTVKLIKQLRSKGIKTGVVSSSRNCHLVLASVNLLNVFDVCIDGVLAGSLKLAGKPKPDTFVTCAKMLDADPQRCIVVEDAVGGVEAGVAGKFGLVVGIDRANGGNRSALLNAGADLVIDDFAQISIWHLNDFFPLYEPGWTLVFDGFIPEQEPLRESLCVLGNGYFATRGCAEEAVADDKVHYPGTYLGGGYNRLETDIEGTIVVNEDLVNFPNWTRMTFRKRDEGRDWFSWNSMGKLEGSPTWELLRYKQLLDVRQGSLLRRYSVKHSASGEITTVQSQRIVHMKKPHLALLKYTIIPDNWSGTLEIQSLLDAGVENRGVPRYRDLNGKHLRVLEKGEMPVSTRPKEQEKGVYVVVVPTKSSRIVAMAARTRLFYKIGSQLSVQGSTLIEGDEIIGNQLTVDVKAGDIIQVEKLVSLYTSIDRGVFHPLDSAISEVQRNYVKNWYNITAVHDQMWTSIWRRADVKVQLERRHVLEQTRSKQLRRVSSSAQQADPETSRYLRAFSSEEGDGYTPTRQRASSSQGRRESFQSLVHGRAVEEEEYADHVTHHSEFVKLDDEGILNAASSNIQFLLRFHNFHLLQTVSLNTIGTDVSIPARGLHGEAYRGHIFWDELFVVPIYTLRLPEITRTLLLYRFYRLDAARQRAKELGYYGACYPWQSGSSGREETQLLHFNPVNHTWGPDNSSLQYHVNIAIFFNIWYYFRVTGDVGFMELYGAEMLLEITRFWAHKATYNQATDRYDIDGVMGPDEFHEQYPNAKKPGLKNNAYTNIMVAWCLERSLYILNEMLSENRRLELMRRLHVNEKELELWEHMSRRMTVIFHSDYVISQFEGWEDLKEFDWKAYKEKYGNVRRLDRILKAENDSPDHYKVAKQADTCMLFFLLTTTEFLTLMKRLGYPYSEALIKRTIKYYLQHTSHGSTLSLVVYSAVIYRFDPELSWNLYRQYVVSDIADTQQGTTAEGIHVVPMAASILQPLLHLCGIDTTRNAVRINPHVIRDVAKLSVRFQYQHQWVTVSLDSEVLTVSVDPSGSTNREKVPVLIRDSLHFLLPGSSLQFQLV